MSEIKLLTFDLGAESYGIPILQVREIIGMMDITYVPKMPQSIKGVINLRGKIIPVMDLRLKMGMDEKEYGNRNSIIVVETDSENGIKQNGLVVDTVSEVTSIDQDQIEDPSMYGSYEESLLSGIGKMEDKVIMLIEASRILTEDEISKLDGMDEMEEMEDAN